MLPFLKRFIPNSLNEPRVSDDEIGKIIDKELSQIRSFDSETKLQWLRLQRAMNEREVRSTRTRFTPRLAFGTMVVAIAIAAVYLFMVPDQLSSDAFVTGKGEQKQFVLRDSSEVTLNYTTRLVVQEIRTGEPRLLGLSGEAYFRVRRAGTPFIVSTSCADVQVVGTEFNLRARDKVLEISVTHGIVKVTAIKDGKDSTLTLTQNQMALCPQGEFPRFVGALPSAGYPGWMNGKIFLANTPFADACREIEMRFDVAILINDRKLREERITGTLDAHSAESAMTALCGLTGKTFKRGSDGFVVY